MNITKVVCKDTHPYDVYIGRGSPFGNPYEIGKHGTREEVIASYRNHLFYQIDNYQIDFKLLLSLEGKTLGCYCPTGLPCHGYVIIEGINYLKDKLAKRELFL